MRKRVGFVFAVAVVVLFCCVGVGKAFADDDGSTGGGERTEKKGIEGQMFVDLLPAQSVLLDGDDEKFRQIQWMNNKYVGGANQISGRFKYPEDITFDLEGRALAGQNDYDGILHLEKKDFGFVSFEYVEFSKYFDGSGGVYNPNRLLAVSELDKELELEIGHFALEAGLRVPKFPETTLFYEREFEDGSKSRTAWGTVTDTAGNGRNQKISPTYQDIHTMTDIFGIRAKHEVNGYVLNGEQRWEFVKSETFREAREVCNTSVTSTACEVYQLSQSPDTNVMTTTLRAERWFSKDMIHVSSGYRYANLRYRETEESRVRNGLGTILSNAENKVGARADSQLDTHTWVSSLMAFLTKTLNVGGKTKVELVKRKSSSTYPQDNTLDGTINLTDMSRTNDHIVRFGENGAIRYKGIPRAALYTEADFQQDVNSLDEFRDEFGPGEGTSEDFHRKTDAFINRGALALGAHVAPLARVNVTVQGRHRWNNSDFDDEFEQPVRAANGRQLSAFIESQDLRTSELSSRAKWTPFSWLTSSVRYQWRVDDFEMTVQDIGGETKADTTSHIYTADVTVQPLENVFVTGYFSRYLSTTSTIAHLVAAYQPDFKSDVDTWLGSIEYVPSEHWVWNGTVLYSDADNFNDFTGVGLPLGADFTRIEVSLGAKWTPRKDVSVGPKCAYYRYDSNPAAERNDYDAFAFFLEGSVALG